jgi:hypothetical protein
MVSAGTVYEHLRKKVLGTAQSDLLGMELSARIPVISILSILHILSTPLPLS